MDVRKAFRWLSLFITNGVVLILLFAISFTLIGLDLVRTNHTSQRQAHLAQEQAQLAQLQATQAQQEAERNRVIVCSITEKFLSAPAGPSATARSNALAETFAAARSPQGADCTPDPKDGR